MRPTNVVFSDVLQVWQTATLPPGVAVSSDGRRASSTIEWAVLGPRNIMSMAPTEDFTVRVSWERDAPSKGRLGIGFVDPEVFTPSEYMYDLDGACLFLFKFGKLNGCGRTFEDITHPFIHGSVRCLISKRSEEISFFEDGEYGDSARMGSLCSKPLHALVVFYSMGAHVEFE